MRALEFISEKAGGRFTFGRSGATGGKGKGKITRKFRCVSGPRKGRIVAKMSTCHAPIDAQKKRTMKITRSKKPSMTALKAKFTKKGSGVSRAIAQKNVARAPRVPKRRFKN